MVNKPKLVIKKEKRVPDINKISLPEEQINNFQSITDIPFSQVAESFEKGIKKGK